MNHLRSARKSRHGHQPWSPARAALLRAALLGAALVALVAQRAEAQRRGMSQDRQLSIAVGAGLAVGGLSQQASGPGIGVALRTATPLGASNWLLRTDVSFDRFSGTGDVDNNQFFTFATNAVHRTNTRLYQFGGLGIYTAKKVLKSSTLRSETAFGLQGGVGLEFGSDREGGSAHPFVEFGLTDAFTTGRTSVWFPVRVGLRF